MTAPMDPEKRERLLQMVKDGMKYKDIAKALDMTVGAVKQRLYTSRKAEGGKLRKQGRPEKPSDEKAKEKKRIVVFVDSSEYEDIHRKLKIAAAIGGVSLSEIALRACREYLKQYRFPKGPGDE